MRQGFIFNYRLCVNCRACNAACMLENDWQFAARRIFVHNGEAFDPGPVINISMACSHCTDPSCMKGCPTSAYYRDVNTGAVLIDARKCIGCRYCDWNCPYDAPKYNSVKKIVEKCHFCHHLLNEGSAPACSTACPTGALGFGNIPETVSLVETGILPEKGINPSYFISGKISGRNPEMIPALSRESLKRELSGEMNADSVELSLILFTFLSTLSVAFTIPDLFSGNYSYYPYSLAATLVAGFGSLFHLGSKLKAWRSVTNIHNSPLSREILAFLVFGGLLLAAPVVNLILFRVMLSLTGLVLLLLIDNVYSYSFGKEFRFHSGQVFITSLLIISFLSRQTLPFLFIASLKLIIILGSGQLTAKTRSWFGLRFLRIFLLLISMAVIIAGTAGVEVSFLIIFLTGELIDRFLFYTDFVPVNIKQTINKQINISSDEKEND